MHRKFFLPILIFSLFSCSRDGNNPEPTPTDDSLYFPENSVGANWETKTPESLNWDTSQLPALYTYLESQNTRAFLVLKNGRIIIEKYWGKNLGNTANFDQNSLWYWASAGKTITSFLVGIAQQENKLNIADKTSKYLGIGWTSMPINKENLITIRHQLTMTTGVDYNVPDITCTDPSCLLYKADAGTQWYYHNATYTLLDNVIQSATGSSLNTYCDQKLETTTGMSGQWYKSDNNNVYYSTPRDMARFGLLILNRGKWKTTTLLQENGYYDEMTNTSQNINPSYGYLWWLNGKSSVVYPGSVTSYPISVAPNAPAEMFSALGKNGQILDIVKSQKLLVIRMGDSSDASDVPIQLHNNIWGYLSKVIK